MKQFKKVEGIKEISVSGNHLCYVDVHGDLLLDNELLQKGQGYIGVFKNGYLKYSDVEKEQVVIHDLKTKKELVLPEGIGINLRGEYSPEFHAYSYVYDPKENKSSFYHIVYNLEENKSVKELSIERKYAYLSSYKQYSIFANYDGRPISSISLYSGSKYVFLWEHSFSNIEMQGNDIYIYTIISVSVWAFSSSLQITAG